MNASDNSDLTSGVCPQCQTKLDADAPLGLCAECLLKLGFESEANNLPTSAYRAPFVAPTPEHLAPLFPQLEIEERIGHGGMGVVYRARQRQLDRTVALKILRPDLDSDPTFAERFQREAKLLARLQHPNIVSVYDVGQAGKLFYLIMEYVEGANLRHIERAGELTPKSAMQIVPQICQALEFAHEHGVVHRDIKPENILLNTNGDVKIADFGLAKMGGRTDDFSLTAQGQVMGTPHYMAPEQVERPSEVDHRADIYSLGVVFYEMLTGELPLGRFSAPSDRARVDERLDGVVMRALEKQPEQRYQRVSDVQVDINRLAESKGSVATRSGRADWSGVLHGENGLLLAADCLWWCAILDLVLGGILLFLSMGDDDFIPFALMTLTAGVVGNATSKLLRYREYFIPAAIGSLLLLVPVPCFAIRMFAAIWAIGVVLTGKIPFSSPRIKDSQTLAELQSVLGFFRRTASKTATRAGEIAQAGTGSVVVAARSRRASTIAGSVAFMAAWTVICALTGFAIHGGWTSVFAPKKISINDLSASRIVNPYGFDQFSLIGRSWRTVANAPGRKDLYFDSIEIHVETDYLRTSSYYKPATDTLELEYLGERRTEPATSEALESWLKYVAEVSQMDTIVLANSECKESTERMLTVFKTARREFENRSIVPDELILTQSAWDRPSILQMLAGSPLGQQDRNSWRNRSVRVYASDVQIVAFVFAAGFWLLGFFAQLPALVAVLRNPGIESAATARRQGISLAIAVAVGCALVALVGYLSQLWLHGHSSSWDAFLQPYVWFRHPNTTTQFATSLLALSVVACLSLAVAARFHFTFLARIRVSSLAGLIALTTIGATLYLVSFAPWLHHWPLLLPCWLTLATMPLLMWYGRTATSA